MKPTAAFERVGTSTPRVALARLRRDRTGMACAGIVAGYVLVAVFAPQLAWIEGQDPATLHQDLLDRYGVPTFAVSTEHWFGLEPRLGRDLFARWVYGSRPTLLVAGIATVLTTVVGVTLGMVAGFVGGWVDRAISWLIDFVLALPFLLFAVASSAVLLTVLGEPEDLSPETTARVRFLSLVGVLSLFGWAGLARLIRAEVLTLRELEFVTAARALGAPTTSVLVRELLPNLTGPIVVSMSLALPTYVVAEAGLTYLGVGLTEPLPSWGLLIADAQHYHDLYPVYLWIPVLGLTVLVVALSLLGDAVRDAFDPRVPRRPHPLAPRGDNP